MNASKDVLGQTKKRLMSQIGRPDLYDAQRAQWKNVASEEAREMRHPVVETTLPLAINVEHVLEALHIPHFACSL